MRSLARDVICALLVALSALSASSLARAATPSPTAATAALDAAAQGTRAGDKHPLSGQSTARDLILDGSVVHNVGAFWVNMTNFGLIGSTPGSSSPFSHAPSVQVPGTGINYLYAAGIWVGALVDGQPRVSTGVYSHAFLPDPSDPADRIYIMSEGENGARRCPSSLLDDDQDGVVDEDPRNGRDDDLDGAVDEDDAAIGDQCFRCEMRDDRPLAVTLDPTHMPLGLAVVQRSFQWSAPGRSSFVGLEFTLRNVGTNVLDDLYFGLFADADVGGAFADDLPGHFRGSVRVPDGSLIPIDVVYAYDVDGDAGQAPGYLGFVLLDHAVDPTGMHAPAALGLTGFHHFDNAASQGNHAPPTDDTQRYAVLAAHEIQDVPTDPGVVRDTSLLPAVGPFGPMHPGDALQFVVAMVLGQGLEGLERGAADAALLYAGRWFDCDGNPATGIDGREQLVHWIDAGGSVPIPRGTLTGESLPDVAALHAWVEFGWTRGLSIVRRPGPGLSQRSWTFDQLGAIGAATTGLRADLRDADAGSWPRNYALVLETPWASTVLSALTVERTARARLALRVAPNPCNPRAELRWAQPKAALAELTIHDARGRRVCTLVRETQGVGEHAATWNGNDDGGRPLASGVYLARLTVAGTSVTQRVTLAR